MSNDALRQELIQGCKDNIAELRRELEPLETGAMSVGSRRPGGHWIDQTDERIVWIKKTIAKFEKTIARVETDLDNVLRARPVEGAIEQGQLTREIIARFPNILAELAK
jgi:hypothetical protein